VTRIERVPRGLLLSIVLVILALAIAGFVLAHVGGSRGITSFF
jgi:VIT1/CCC1 family predicted Fe2+/Mn2+ transporter